MKVSELSGCLLDYWAAKAQGDREVRLSDGRCEARFHPNFEFSPYSPSAAWMHGGPIIEREGIGIVKFYEPADGPIPEGAEWVALSRDDKFRGDGPAPLIAAMRAYVAAKFGAEAPDVDLPKP